MKYDLICRKKVQGWPVPRGYVPWDTDEPAPAASPSPPKSDPLRDALIDIAYDSADLPAAQRRAREALA